MNKFMLILAIVSFVGMAPVTVKADDAKPGVVKTAELDDGTKISIEGDTVYVVAADGTKTGAPDGEHTLKDGSKIIVKDGKIAP